MRRFPEMLEGVYSASTNEPLLFSNTLKNISGKRRMGDRMVREGGQFASIGANGERSSGGETCQSIT